MFKFSDSDVATPDSLNYPGLPKYLVRAKTTHNTVQIGMTSIIKENSFLHPSAVPSCGILHPKWLQMLQLKDKQKKQ